MSIEQWGVYWVDFDPARGREQRGLRPGLVISRNEINRLPLTVTVIAATGAEHLDATRRFPTDLWVTTAEVALPKDSVFMGIHIRSIDPARIGAKIGNLPESRMPEVWRIVRYLVGDDRTP